jgi:hypothetical protein
MRSVEGISGLQAGEEAKKSMVESQAVINPVPFDRPRSPMFFDGLGEIRPHELGAGRAPLRSVLAKNNSLRGAWVIAAAEVIDLAAQSVDGVATVVLEEWNAGQSKQMGGSIASIAAPEVLVRWIGDIEHQEGIRQMGVGHRVTGGTPFTEQNQALMLRLLQKSLQGVTMQGQPSRQA